MQIKHLHEIADEIYGKCYAITGYADSKEEYTTFLTPESTKALDDYLEYRASQGHLLFPDSFVFVGKKYDGQSSSSSKNLGASVVYVVKKAGLRNPSQKKGSRYPVPTNHGFRHRFNEIIKSSNLVNPHIAEKFLSHKSQLIPLDSVYFSPNLETMFAEYKKVIPLLTINPSEQLLIENKKLESENLDLKEEHKNSQNEILAKIESKERELDELKAQDLLKSEAISQLSDKITHLTDQLEFVKNQSSDLIKETKTIKKT